MYAKVFSIVTIGIDAIKIDIEVDAINGLPSEQIVGLPDKAIRESKNRIKSAIRNAGFSYPIKSIIINLSPADLPKEGSLYDLPIAVALLKATGQISISNDFFIVGELGLDGCIKPIQGAVSMADFVNKSSFNKLLIPCDNAIECRFFPNIKIFPIRHLSDIVSLKSSTYEYVNRDQNKIESVINENYSDVKGNSLAKRALEISMVGKHNLLFAGSPGCGKSMLMKRIPSILPPLSQSEAIECLKINSLSKTMGHNIDISFTPPFLSPHHSISLVGLVGGGQNPRPGMISQSHNGVLFLDEFPEFSKQSIESLRQPLEDGIISISRSQYSLTFPANFQLVLCMNPCPCGYLYDDNISCRCTQTMIKKYQQKISGPIMDRIDIILSIKPIRSLSFHSQESTETSEKMKNNILKALEFKKIRLLSQNSSNGQTNKLALTLSTSAKKLIDQYFKKYHLSSRSYHSLIKVSRSIADLNQEMFITESAILEAFQFKKSLFIV